MFPIAIYIQDKIYKTRKVKLTVGRGFYGQVAMVNSEEVPGIVNKSL